ncbi:MAG: glycosyltransferase family 2 protein [Thermoleophilia bacterium]|nr:glycosyltransferase family 2 protein [Thermoleophilia bacterium]
MNASPRVTAIVLSWNGCDRTLACLRSLEAVTYAPFTVLVVDNGSSDGSADAVAQGHLGVTLVRLPENVGFAGGMNAGMESAFAEGADAVVLLNNDMEVDPGFVAPLAAAASADPACAAACSQILFDVDPPRIWYAGARFRRNRGHGGRNVGYGQPPLPQSAPAYLTDRACGGAMYLTSEAFGRIGPFDEDLFAYAEDTDWSLRAQRSGLHCLVVPASAVRHSVSGSSGGESSPTSIYYSLRNSLVVAERWAPLGPVRTWLRRLEAVSAYAVQAMLSGRRADGMSAVRAAWRDFRHGQLGPRSTQRI